MSSISRVRRIDIVFVVIILYLCCYYLHGRHSCRDIIISKHNDSNNVVEEFEIIN